MGVLKAKLVECEDCGPQAVGRILKSDQSGRIFKLLPFRRQPKGARPVGALSELNVGERGILETLELPENVQNHLMHMGFVPGSCIQALRRAPAGDPTVYCVDGMEIALRHETAGAIRVKVCTGLSATGEPMVADEVPELVEAAQ